MKLIPLCLFLVLLCFQSQSQNPLVGLTYGGPNEDQGIVVKKTSDGNLLIIGFSSSFSNSSDIYLIKVDAKGKLIWEKTYGGKGDDYGWDMEEVDGGKNYLIVGFSDSYGQGDTDIVLLKVSGAGEMLWIKNLQAPADDDRAVSMEKTQEGNFVLIGQSKNLKTKDYDGLVVCVNPEGEVLWKTKLGVTSYDRLFYGKENGNGDFLLTGISRKHSVSENSGWVVFVDRKGTEKKSNLYNAVNNTTPHGLIKDSNNIFYVVGYAQTDTAKNQRAIYLASFNKRADLIWEKTLDEEQLCNTHGLSGAVDSRGEIMITGYTRPLQSGKWNGVLFKTTNKGDLLWRKEFGDTEADMPYTIELLSDGRCAMVGQTYSSGKGKNDVWLVFMDEKGNIK